MLLEWRDIVGVVVGDGGDGSGDGVLVWESGAEIIGVVKGEAGVGGMVVEEGSAQEIVVVVGKGRWWL